MQFQKPLTLFDRLLLESQIDTTALSSINSEIMKMTILFRSHWTRVLIFISIIVISALYLRIAFSADRPVAPLDDAYITYQYARQIARGYPYQYNDNDTYTTGMTSLLFGYFLALAYRIGFIGENLVGFSIVLGVAWLGLTTVLTYRVSTLIMGANNMMAFITASLVLFTGSIQWHSFNGMETGLFTVLTMAALYAFLSSKFKECAVYLCIAGLTRPEGVILTVLLGGIYLFSEVIIHRRIPWRETITISVAFFLGLTPYLINYLLTGTTAASGLEVKSWIGNIPSSLSSITTAILETYRQIIVYRFMGGDWYVPFGLMLFTCLGFGKLVRERKWLPAAALMGWIIIGTASTATLMTALWHLGRYQVPFIPSAILLSVYSLLPKKQKQSPRMSVIYRYIGLFILFSTASFSTFHYSGLYKRAVITGYQVHIALADWIRDNLPENAILGVHDAGVLRYISDRYTFDLIGLTTPHAALPWRHGPGSVYEFMEQAPKRPLYFVIIFPDVYSIPYFRTTNLMAKQLFSADAPAYSSSTSGPDQGIWQADWHLADSGQKIIQPDIHNKIKNLRLVDSVDVADLSNEEQHSLTWWQDALYPGFPTEVQQLPYRVSPAVQVLDGGRLLTGGVSFIVSTQPGQDLVLVARLHPREAGRVNVSIDGTFVGSWNYPPLPGQWLETLFQIPATYVKGTSSQIELDIVGDFPGFRHFALYYMWAFQGKYNRIYALGTQHVGAVFDGRLELDSIDLREGIWHVGDDITCTLYWKTDNGSASDAKLFLHLYDEDGALVAQADGWPYYDTRPPYTWRPNEVVPDPREINIPTDLLPGLYTLEVGLYDATGRLSAFIENTRQTDDRVILAKVQIQK